MNKNEMNEMKWPYAKINNAEHLIAEFNFRGSAEFGRSALLTWPKRRPFHGRSNGGFEWSFRDHAV